jgi:hypothetical protein
LGMGELIEVSRLDHAPDLARELGDMVVAWANAETALSFAFAAVCKTNVNDVAGAYYRIPTFESRTKVIRAFLVHFTDPRFDASAISLVVTKLNGLAKSRNKWIHGVWATDPRRKETFVLSLRETDPSKRRTPVKASDVHNHVEAVRARTQDLFRLLPGMVPELP